MMFSLPTRNQIVNGIIASYLDINDVMVLFRKDDMPSYGFECDLRNYVIGYQVYQLKPLVIEIMMKMGMKIRGIHINSNKHCALKCIDGRFVWIVDKYLRLRSKLRSTVECVFIGDEKFCRDLRYLVLDCVNGVELNSVCQYVGLRELNINVYKHGQSDIYINGLSNRKLRRLNVVIGNGVDNVRGIILSDFYRLTRLEFKLNGRINFSDIMIGELSNVVEMKFEKCCGVIELEWLNRCVRLKSLRIDGACLIHLNFLSVCLEMRKLELLSGWVGIDVRDWEYVRNSSLTHFVLHGNSHTYYELDLNMFDGLVSDSLECLSLRDCVSIKNYNVIKSMKRLKTLRIKCWNILYMECGVFEKCVGLEDLDIDNVCIDCGVFGGNMGNLRTIIMKRVHNLVCLEVGENVGEIMICNCGQLKRISFMGRLKYLEIRYCNEFIDLDGLMCEKVTICNCHSLKNIVVHSKVLKSLTILDCRGIKNVSVRGCSNLGDVTVKITSCKRLKNVDVDEGVTVIVEDCVNYAFDNNEVEEDSDTTKIIKIVAWGIVFTWVLWKWGLKHKINI